MIAGLADVARPANRLSLTQSTALAATGTHVCVCEKAHAHTLCMHVWCTYVGSIWARYSLVIIPKNWNLFYVNIFVAVTGFYQLFRIYK